MKKQFLINLLVVMAMGLCTLCAYQWSREATLRQSWEKQSSEISKQAGAIQGLQGSLRLSEEQTRRLDERVNELKGTVKTNQTDILNLQRELKIARTEKANTEERLESYKKAFEVQKATSIQQNEDLKKMDGMLKTIAGQRDEYVQKFTDALKERNEIVQKYNDFVEEVKKLQQQYEAAAAAKDKK